MLATVALALFQANPPSVELTPQQLIDIAPPGSVVTLEGSDPLFDPHYDGYPSWSLRIDKPLTVIGNRTWVRNIFLEGPGSGEVVLQDIFATHLHWCLTNCFSGYEWAPHGPFEGAVIASGFDSVRLYGCRADGRMEVQGANLVVLDRTSLSVWDDFPALTAPGATVVVTDSDLRNNLFGGRFGIHDAAEIYCVGTLPSIRGIPTFLIAPNLTMTGSSRLGGRLNLDWRAFGYGVLWADVGVRPPRPAWGGAWNFLGDSPTFAVLARRAVVPIPVSRELIGLEVTFQATDFGGRYSRPAFALIRP